MIKMCSCFDFCVLSITQYQLPILATGKERCPQQHPNQYIIHQQSGELEEDIVLFTCEKGYVLVGASHVTCLSTGQWSNEWPSCERK